MAGARAGTRRAGVLTACPLLARADMYNGKEMDGRVVEVRLDRRSKTTASSTRVFVGNLAWGVTWMDLKDHFRAAGEVLHATVFKDGDRSKV